MSPRLCAIVPTYDNPATIAAVVERVSAQVEAIIVVDDGSGPEGRAACAALSEAGLADVIHLPVNGGKGAAVKRGFARASERGFTHAFQVDADGQHDIEALPAFLDAMRAQPAAAIFGAPRYDETQPSARKWARRITTFWVDLEAGRGVIEDAMIGFRIYPLDAVQRLNVRADRMDFDVEIAVQLAWAKVPIVNLPVGVRYLDADEGGVSHFKPFRDNLRLSLMHSRLCTRLCMRWFFETVLRRRPALPGGER